MEIEERTKLLQTLANQAKEYKRDKGIESPLTPILKGVVESEITVGSNSIILFGGCHRSEIKAVVYVTQPTGNCLDMFTAAKIPVFLLHEGKLKGVNIQAKIQIGSSNLKICAEYKKYLLGTPFAKLDLTKSQQDVLKVYIENASTGQSLFQIQQRCLGTFPAQLLWELKQVQRGTRRKVKAAQSDMRAAEKLTKTEPQIVLYTKKNLERAKKAQCKV